VEESSSMLYEAGNESHSARWDRFMVEFGSGEAGMAEREGCGVGRAGRAMNGL
jgi:hypothetical protein